MELAGCLPDQAQLAPHDFMISGVSHKLQGLFKLKLFISTVEMARFNSERPYLIASAWRALRLLWRASMLATAALADSMRDAGSNQRLCS